MKKSFLFILLLSFILNGCKNVNNKPATLTNVKTLTQVLPKNKSLAVNVYIENSGSMDGYIFKESEFKDVIRNFTSDIPTYFSVNPGLYFVNSNGTCPSIPNNASPDYIKFISGLSPNNFKSNCTPGKNSSIDNIIDFCTKNMKDKISVLFTDCILSYENTKQEGAKSAQANIKVFMSKKIREENVSTLIIKFNSLFNGPYYNESNGGIKIKIPSAINRPFYALIFGESKSLISLLSKIDFTKYKGYESSYTLISNNTNSNPSSIVTYENKMGSFEFVKPASLMKIINAEPKKGTSEFQFSINTNLNQQPFEEDFITNISQYQINENFKVKSIEKDINNTGYTHLMTFSTNDLKQISNLNIGLKYSIPKWISYTGSDVDDNPMDTTQQKQTFGFKYLMMGMSEAYIAANNSDSLQFKIPITVIKNGSGSKSSSNFKWWIIIAFAFLIGTTIYLKNKN